MHRFQKFAFSMKTIRLHDNDIIITIAFSNLSTFQKLSFSVKMIIVSVVFDRFRVDARWERVYGFDESYMKT